MSRSWLLVPLILLYLLNLGGVGFVGPDEPRYASIGREMAHSGDWVTPRLDGSPWYEKPPLLYWMNGVSQRLGLRDEWAARLLIALSSLAFLWFYFATLEREFSLRVAAAATAILATSAGWLAYSFAGLTDLPMAVALGTAMLLAVFDTRPHRGYIPGAMIGLAMLAKGFVPAILFAPVWLIARRNRIALIIGAVAVAAPWYVLCWMRNGHAFWDDFFWKQQVQRFLTPERQHVQPFWYYLPVLLAGLFPWTPLFPLIFQPKIYKDIHVRFLAIWVALGFVFFSASLNKLPGYLLPLMPALAVLLAIALDKTPGAQYWLGSCVILLAAFPLVAAGLPEGLRTGLSHVQIPRDTLLAAAAMAIPVAVVAGAVIWLGIRGQVSLAMFTAAMATAVGAGYLKARTFPVLDQQVSVRQFWERDASLAGQVCVDPALNRALVYGLNYYANRPLSDCAQGAENVARISMIQGQLRIVTAK